MCFFFFFCGGGWVDVKMEVFWVLFRLQLVTSPSVSWTEREKDSRAVTKPDCQTVGFPHGEISQHFPAFSEHW